MKNKGIGLVVIAGMLAASSALAATEWSTQEYDLYPGDFDGDGKTDLLYVAKDASHASGIARSDGSGPNVAFQSWPSNYLGIPWYSNLYNVLVADFDGNGKADVFLQRKTPGDHYLLQADANGKITGISQTIANGALTLTWSADQHKLHAGDFDGNGKADLFLQATSPSITNAVVLSDANGLFTVAATQSWTDASWSAFKWSTRHSNVFVGDFNGDGKKDLLLQAKPTIVLIDYDVPIPVPTYQPNTFGVVKSQGGTTPFAQIGVQQWSRNANGVDWSPNAADIVVGNFDGTGGDDVLLQARSSGRPSYLLAGNTSGNAFSSGTALATNVTWSADSYRLIAGNFDSGSGVGVYYQAQITNGTNYYANVVTGSSVSQTAHNPSAATGVLPTSAIGHTVGSFAVSSGGSATYSIPIVVPPGVAGVQPELSLNYDSGAGNGLSGVGWSFAGLSEIERCGKTLAQDNSTDGVALSTADRFCLDGNKLRLTGGTYGVAGSTYQTELETFSRVTAYGTAGNGPAYFIVETKEGLRMEYGNSSDSRIEAVNASGATTTPHTWALSSVSDRHGNTMSVTYQEDGAPNGSFRPYEITYTSNATAGLAAAYRVRFEWENRPAGDTLFQYVAGSSTLELKRLKRLETQYNDPVGGWRVVRKYQLSYNTSGVTPRSRLSSVQECDGSGACLAPTTVDWYDGFSGWVDTNIGSSTSTDAVMEGAHALDIDADGRTDLVYPQVSGSNAYWHAMRATAAGQYAAPMSTTFASSTAMPFLYTAIPIDYSATGRQGLLTSITGNAELQIIEWNPATSTLVKTPTNITATLQGNEWVGDFNGDGREDYLYVTVASGTATFSLRANAGMSGGVAQFASPVTFYSMSVPLNAAASATLAPYSPEADFNGDGRTDLLVRTKYLDCDEGACVANTTWYALLSSGGSFVSAGFWSCEGSTCGTSRPGIADFNGDGYTDAIALAGTPQSKSYTIRYGHSRGMSSATLVANFSSVGNATLATDYDGDGRTDWLYVNGTTWSVLRATATGFEPAVATNIPTAGTNDTHRVLDIDGDGQGDIGFKDSTWKVRKHRGSVSDLVRSIADGFGNTVSVSYAPLTDPSVYTKGTGNTFPIVDVIAPVHVVKQYTATDGIGGTRSVSETYSQARSHMQGRGFLGFASRSSVDGLTGIKTTSTYRQDYPYIGSVEQTSTYQPGGSTLIAQVTNTLTELPPQGATYNDRHFPYVQQSEQTNYEVGGAGNGQPIARVTTTTAVDSYGNPTNISSVTLDLSGSGQSFTTTTVNTYDTADTTNWCLSFPTQQEVKNTIPGLPLRTRTVSFVKDPSNPAKCRVYQQIVEPGTDDTIKVTTTFGYDAFGHPNSEAVSAASIASRTTAASYGTEGVFPRSVTNALGQVASKTYDYALGVPKTATDPNGLVVTFDYDGFGRLIQENRPDGTKTALTYSACSVGNGYCGDSRLRYQVEKRELDTGGGIIRTSRQLFDAFGRSLYGQSQTLSGAFTNVATNYDNQGRAYQQSQPYFSGFPAYFTTITYDLLGRPIQEQRRISEADSGTQTTTYAYNRLIHSQTDANGKTTTKQFDAIGQVVKVIDAALGITEYEYDQFGNLRTTKDPAGNQIVNVFNVRGFKTSTNDPDMGNWGYTYYPTGELWTQTDAKGQVTTFTYDKLSRPLTRIEPEGTTTFLYGTSATSRNIGKLEYVSSPGGYSESFSYDSLGRLQDATTNADATSFVVSNAYNSSTGFLETVTYPTSTSAVTGSRFKVKYEYEAGLLKRTRDFHSPSAVYWEQVATNAAGQTIDELFGNGLHTYSNYDGITGLLGARTAGASSQIQNLTYQWDKIGNLKQRKDNALNLTEDFNYDSLYRLDDVKLNNIQTLDMKYDALGNITEKNEPAVTAFNYSTSQSGCTYYSHSQPHAVRKVGAAVYCYDANGNMTRRAGSDITWYSYNMPSRIDNGSNYSQFYYGADRGRYKQVAYIAAGGSLPAGTETTIYVGGLFEKVSKPSGVTEYKHYILAGGEAIALRTLRSNSVNDTRYLHKDHLGSVDVITNESGTVVQRLSYDAFGKRRSATAWAGALNPGDWTSIAAVTHRGYTFHEELDNVDLIHMNGRVYDADIARFISADPFVQAPLMSQSLNRYSYVMNNPLSLVDPSGYSWFSKKWKKFKRAVRRTWDTIRTSFNYIAAAALFVVGTVMNIMTPGSGLPLYKVAAALVASPVHVGYGRDGPWVGVGFQIGGVRVPGPSLSLGGGGGSLPPMTAPPGAISFTSTVFGATQMLEMLTAPWGGWEDFKDSIRSVWEGEMPGNGSLEANLAGLPPIIGGITRAPNLLRPLQASDFGVKSLKALEGSLRVDGSLATVTLRNIEGNLGHYMGALNKLKDTARATGATTLRLEGTVANPTLLRALERVLGPAQRGMPGAAQDYWLITL